MPTTISYTSDYRSLESEQPASSLLVTTFLLLFAGMVAGCFAFPF